MVLACLIAARDYYINYQIDVSLNQPENFCADDPIKKNPTSAESSTVTLAGCSDRESVEQYQTLHMTKGDTLASLLAKLEIPQKDIEAINKSLKGHFNPRGLKIGQAFSVKYKKD